MVKTVTVAITGEVTTALDDLKSLLKQIKAKYPTLLIQVSETEAETY